VLRKVPCTISIFCCTQVRLLDFILLAYVLHNVILPYADTIMMILGVSAYEPAVWQQLVGLPALFYGCRAFLYIPLAYGSHPVQARLCMLIC
jgi:hypothetical protein